MDVGLRSEIAGAIAVKNRDTKRQESGLRVVAPNRDHKIMDLNDGGFVIESEGRPPLPGYVEIFRGDQCIDQRLVVCEWARDGLVGYRFKRASRNGQVAADYAPNGLAGLIAGPID